MKKLMLQGHSIHDGAAVKLKRIFAHDHTELADPFRLLDHFGSDNPDDYARCIALPRRFGRQIAATVVVGASSSKWSHLGQLANDESFTRGWHRGKKLGALRDASASELSGVRAIACHD